MERLKQKFGIVKNGKIVNIVSAYDINDIKAQYQDIIEDSSCEIGDKVYQNKRLIKKIVINHEPFTTLIPLSKEEINELLNETTT